MAFILGGVSVHDIGSFFDSAPSWVTPAIVVAGVVLLGVMAAVLIRFRAPTKPGPVIDEPFDSPDPRMMMKEVEDTRARAAELIGVVQRWSSRLDDKMRRLDELLADAEKQLRRLEKFDPRPAATPPPPMSRAPTIAIESKQPRIGDRDALASAVYRLADAGRLPLDIARELNEQVGKVELILALRSAGPAA